MKGGAHAEVALHIHESVVLVNDAVRDGEAEAGAGAFCGEEGIEDVGHVFGADAVAGVANAQANVGFGDDLAPEVELSGFLFDHGGADLQEGAAFFERINGVQEQIEEGLNEEVMVAGDEV